MSYHTTLEKMRLMKLSGMARSFQSSFEIGFGKMTPDELVAFLIDAEYDTRNNRKFERLLKTADLRYSASIEHLDFVHKRNLDKNQMLRFASNDWLEKKQNIIITGSTGCGKSYIACALGHNACLHNYSVFYFNSSKLFKSLRIASADGTYLKKTDKIKKSDLLILDDFGLDSFDNQTRLFLLEILEDRIGLKSTIITSQIPINHWHEVIGESNIADAFCDRILHSAHRIELNGESLRRIFSKDLT